MSGRVMFMVSSASAVLLYEVNSRAALRVHFISPFHLIVKYNRNTKVFTTNCQCEEILTEINDLANLQRTVYTLYGQKYWDT